MSKIAPLSAVANTAVDELLDNAFGRDRHQRTAYLLRQGMPVIDHLSFAIVAAHNVIGSIQCWPISVSGAPLVLVGPVAVSPVQQNIGLGRQLMHVMLEASTPSDPPMVMIGDPQYYGRFGFSADQTGGWTLPGPWEARRLLLRDPANRQLPQTGMLGPRTSL